MAYSDYGYRSSASGPLTPYGRSSRVHRSTSVEAYKVRVYCGHLNSTSDFIIIDALKNTQSEDIVKQTVQKLQLGRISNFELAEAFCSGGQICKERRLEPTDNPVRIQLLWPKVTHHAVDAHRTEHKFFLRKKESDKKVGLWEEVKDTNSVDTFLSTFMQQPEKEYPDLCNLPDLNETTLLDNIKHRFKNGNIYTYIGSILIAVNPFRFYCIYNPKYVRMYQSKKLGELPPHIFAIADAAYHKMLQDRANQCIVISGESGSGKTESTNLLLSHLSALSQKGSFGGGIEQTILGAGPVLEAFGNAKTVHNNNSSRFGKFIQVNYRENGIVHGAVVEKYLLEKSRLVHQAYNERNYHVFYYLLVGCTESQKNKMSLTKPEDFHYLRQSECYTIEDTDGEVIDEQHEFDRLKQSMEMVGFSKDTQSRIYTVLASVLHLGNIEFNKKRHGGHHEAVQIGNQGTVRTISSLLKVKEATLVDALTKKKTQAGGETVVMSYDMNAAIATRDAMAKCLYGALFDWIVLQVNQALISKKDLADHKGNSIGVLDIFGFEDFGNNSFEQFCINYANEHLQYYFNQHIFKYEQEEYVKEGIMWKNIEFIDNTGCLDLFGKRPKGLLNLLDEECNFRSATNETMLSKFIAVHKNNEYCETPQMREDAFYIVHYAGKVKYEIQDFREKNSDLMRHDVMLVLKNSSLAFVRELVGYDPVAMLRWAIVRAFFRSYFAFIEAGRRFRDRGTAPRYGSNIRKHSQLNRAQHLAMSGNMSENARNKKTILVIEKCAAEDTDEDTDESPIHDYENVFPYLQDRRGSGLPDIFNGSHFTAEDYKVMKRASRVLQKSKSFKPKTRAIKQLRDLQRMKTLTGKTQLGPRSSKGKNKPPSVGAQFNYSLSKLMETLNQANPFFIRCIKSNQDKTPLHFDDSLVLRQLRYTGMLATVRIRQSGYNYRVTFQDFIQMYRILLPKGLVSSRIDIERFLLTLDLNTCNYQIGETKVFLREAEKMLLDNALHQAIMKKIINLQRWIKACVERKKFLKMRKASVLIQAQVRSFLAQKQLQNLKLKLYAAIMIQRFFRNFRERKELEKQSNAAVVIQKNERGRQARVRLKSLKEEKEIAEEEEREHQLSAEKRLKQLLEKEKELELQKLADMEMIMLHEHGNQTLDQDIDGQQGVIVDEGFPEQLPFENDKEDVVSEENTDKTISRSSSYVETHFGTDNSDVFTTEASNESETEKVRFETGVEPQSPTTSLDEQHDHLMDSGSDMVIPRISRDRGYSKESFESEFDLSFPESTFPRLKEVVDKQSNENVSEVSPIKAEVAEKSKLPEEETDEWGKLEVEFKLNSSHEFTEDMSKKIGVDIDSTVKEVDNVEYTTVQNMPVTPTELPDYQLNESVPIDNNQQFLMPTEPSSIGKERKHSSEMMAEIEAEIQRRGADFQNSNDGLVKDGETEKKNSMLSNLSIGAYIVGKDKTSISDELDDGYNDSKQQFEKYIVGKDRDAIHDNKEELTSSAKDRSSKYLVKNKQTETQVSFAKTETDRNEKATLRTNDIQGKSSQDVENTYVVGKDKTDGSPIVSKYKQHKKDTNSSKEKYVRKENKDIYIVERTKLDSLEDDTVTPFMRSEPSSVVTNENTSEQNKPKYAEIVKIKNEPVISTKDSQSSQIASTIKKPQTVPTSVNKESKYDALIPQTSSSKKAQKKYGRQLESTEGLKKTIMPSSSASELRTSQSNSKFIGGRRLSGSNIVEVVETRPFTSAGNLSRDMAGRRGLKPGRHGAQSKVASEELLRGQEEEFTSAQRRHHSEDIDLQEEELDLGDFSQSQPNLKVSKPPTYLASPQMEKERKERRHSDILHMKENHNKGILPGEAMDDVYDGSAVVKHRRKFTDSDYTKATNRSSKVQSVHTVSTPHLRGQEGPMDLEIRIKPAKMVKSISDDHLLTADGPSNARLHHKHVAAPLAQQESLEAPIEEEKGIVTRHLAIENPNRISFVMPGEVEKPLLPGESQESLDHQVLSPLSRAKKTLRNFVAGKTRKKSNEPDAEDSDDSQGEDNVDSSHVKSPAAAPKEAWAEPKQVSTTSKQQKNRRKGTKKRRASKSDMGGNTWTVAGTSKAKYPTKVLVKNPMEMQQLDNFMGHKIREYCKDGEQKQSVFDQVFQQSLKDFHNDLITSLSTSLQESRVEYKYNNLMCKFEEALRSNAKSLGLAEETGDINMGINAFRGFLDEFQRKKVSKELPELPKIKKEKKKKDKEKELIEINGHKYSPVQFSMHTVCEKCNSHVWMVEKGYVCQICHYTVHKKCSKESIVRCKGYIEPKSSHKGKVFSVPLASLVEVGRKIPLVIEKLLTAIETNGLYTTGIYRKAGGAGKVKQLVKDINSDVNSVDFSEEPVHALASLLKQFLRDLPEPLLTYNLYDDFIRGSEISDERERAHAMPEVLEKLPQPNYDLFERLVFHLAKIAQHESSNRMNPSALAIVFAPTILRSDKNLPAQESLSHVPKLSMCMQCIIEEQLRNILNMLVDIQTLDNATLTAEERLSTIRASHKQKKHESMGATAPSLEESMPEEDEEEEEKLLQEQIRSLQDEKEILTVQLPCLDWRASSSEDDLLSTDDYGSTGDEIDQIDRTDSAFAKEETMQFRQQNQQKATGSRKPHKKRRKGSGTDPIGETDPSDPKKRSTPSLKQIGEEEFF